MKTVKIIYRHLMASLAVVALLKLLRKYIFPSPPVSKACLHFHSICPPAPLESSSASFTASTISRNQFQTKFLHTTGAFPPSRAAWAPSHQKLFQRYDTSSS